MLHIRPPEMAARWLPAGAAALLWAVVAGSAVLWWWHLPQGERAPGLSVSVTPTDPGTQGIAFVERALGHTAAAQAAPDAPKRFQLLGVIAAGTGQGSALLAVDGQPPQAFVQGQSVADGWRLQSVGAQGVRLSAGQAGDLELALPDRP